MYYMLADIFQNFRESIGSPRAIVGLVLLVVGFAVFCLAKLFAVKMAKAESGAVYEKIYWIFKATGGVVVIISALLIMI